MRSATLSMLAASTLLACAPPAARSRAATLSVSQLLGRPRPEGAKRIAYGPGASQFGELWLPKSGRSHPVVVLVHGGCWQKDFNLDLMDYAADDLRQRGLAVWNIEYRRLGEAGGGYPGTFLDVGAAVDQLAKLAPRYHLDPRHVVLVGHSSGGQLALWAAARRGLPAASAVHAAHPLPVAGVVTLAGIDDLQTYRRVGPAACGGPATIDALIGAASRVKQDPFADTSPADLLPIGAPQLIISGGLDLIVPPIFGADYAAKAAAAHDAAQAVTIPDAGHFELIDPQAPAWQIVQTAIARIVK
ncbi:MAG: alpha/beta hydrolase family protein [Caulobacteraceae bacterium]